MSSDTDTVRLQDLLTECEFQRVIAIELHRAHTDGPEKHHRDPLSNELRAFLAQLPDVLSALEERDYLDDLPEGTMQNIMLGTLSEVVGSLEKDMMQLIDGYEKKVPYKRLTCQLFILAAQRLIEQLMTEPVCENK